MNPVKHLLAYGYFYGTLPGRRWSDSRAVRSGRAHWAIPTFHRVADDAANAWTTPTADFLRVLSWLQHNFDLVSLDEGRRRMQQGDMPRTCVSITFDDGYAVNSEVALPRLIDENIPVTYFVTVDAVLRGTLFPHDVEMGNRFPANTIEQLRELADAGVEIGAHTRTHADLGAIRERAQLIDEIVTARKELEDALGRAVRYFAWPFGDYRNFTAEGLAIAREAGYEAVCSCYGGYNFAGDDGFHLQRRGVDGELVRMKNWIMRDPFRKRRVRRWTGRETLDPRLSAAS
ncbi:MAG: polysaccharide deacetylase family protein [Planctomycetales bacterium]|nr:polysaccharide deacetylase family protein [Planctomycetales bacterium]